VDKFTTGVVREIIEVKRHKRQLNSVVINRAEPYDCRALNILSISWPLNIHYEVLHLSRVMLVGRPGSYCWLPSRLLNQAHYSLPMSFRD
jgi:hypothetical protein